MEHVAHVDAAGDQVVASGGGVVHGEDQGVRQTRLCRRDSLAEDDGRLSGRRSELHNPKFIIRDVIDI